MRTFFYLCNESKQLDMDEIDYIIETRRLESFKYINIGQQDPLNPVIWTLQEFRIGLN